MTDQRQDSNTTQPEWERKFTSTLRVSLHEIFPSEDDFHELMIATQVEKLVEECKAFCQGVGHPIDPATILRFIDVPGCFTLSEFLVFDTRDLVHFGVICPFPYNNQKIDVTLYSAYHPDKKELLVQSPFHTFTYSKEL